LAAIVKGSGIINIAGKKVASLKPKARFHGSGSRARTRAVQGKDQTKEIEQIGVGIVRDGVVEGSESTFEPKKLAPRQKPPL